MSRESPWRELPVSDERGDSGHTRHGGPAPTRFGPFLVVGLGDHVSLDLLETDGEIASQTLEETQPSPQ